MKITHYKSKSTDPWISYSSDAVQVTPKNYGPGVFLIRKDLGRLPVSALRWEDGSEWTSCGEFNKYEGWE